AAQIVAVVVLGRIARVGLEVVIESRRSRLFVVVLANCGPRARLIPFRSPRGLVAVVEVGERRVAVRVVAGREDRGGGVGIEQQARRFVVGAIAAGDVARADEHLRSGGDVREERWRRWILCYG